MSELKSCPFCGSNNVSFVETEEQPLENSTQGFIYCHGCGFSSDVFHDGVIAKKHWNRRAQPANKPLTLDELREMDGEPVWVKYRAQDKFGEPWGVVVEWMIVGAKVQLLRGMNRSVPFEKLSPSEAIAYRYKPKEAEDERRA